MVFTKGCAKMKNGLIAVLLLTLSATASASSAIREGNTLISDGDNINEVYRLWGNPQFNVTSAKTCNRVIILKKRYCSTSRKVWKQKDLYWMIQYSGSLIIKIGWTRSKSTITEKM